MKNQSKYYIDGFCVTKEKLMDFFQLVSLNIQNPHFLIMQGKIVKVVSMKPTEVCVRISCLFFCMTKIHSLDIIND
mgnify:CR=1 FL=1